MKLIKTAVIGMALLSGSFAFALDNSSEWPVTDFTNSSVDHSEILSGGPPKDGIPAIDDPAFVDIVEASEWLKEKEPVISIKTSVQPEDCAAVIWLCTIARQNRGGSNLPVRRLLVS